MNIFETVKAHITTRQAAEHYGLAVTRNGMVCCPFHNDRHPSMKVDKRYYCFGCQATGDMIDFTAGLFGIGKYDAAKKLAADFGVDTSQKMESILHQTKPKCLTDKEYERKCFLVLSDYLSLLREWKTHYAPASPDEKPHDHFTEACQMYGYIEYLADILTVGNQDIRNQTVQILMKDGKIDHLQDYIIRMKEEQTNEQIA